MVATRVTGPLTSASTRWQLDWRAAIGAGLIAGAVFLVVEMAMVEMFLGMSMWAPPRMIAAIVLGQDVLPMPDGPPPTFDLMVVLVAMVIHFALSVLFTLPLAWISGRMGLGAALGTGAVFGLALYLINFYGMTVFFPWFAMARNWVSIFAHVLFGVIAALAYKKLQRLEPGVVARTSPL